MPILKLQPESLVDIIADLDMRGLTYDFVVTGISYGSCVLLELRVEGVPQPTTVRLNPDGTWAISYGVKEV